MYVGGEKSDGRLKGQQLLWGPAKICPQDLEVEVVTVGTCPVSSRFPESQSRCIQALEARLWHRADVGCNLCPGAARL